MNKKQAAVFVFWGLYIACLGPLLISHKSYELPIAGALLAAAGAWATYRVYFKKEV